MGLKFQSMVSCPLFSGPWLGRNIVEGRDRREPLKLSPEEPKVLEVHAPTEQPVTPPTQGQAAILPMRLGSEPLQIGSTCLC